MITSNQNVGAVTGSQNVIIAASDTVMNRPSRDVLAEVFPGVPLTREIGEFGTLLAIDRAKQVLGYEPRHSWRDLWGAETESGGSGLRFRALVSYAAFLYSLIRPSTTSWRASRIWPRPVGAITGGGGWGGRRSRARWGLCEL